MVEGRCRNDWAHTSAMMALLANIHRDPKRSKVFSPSDFDPYAVAKKKQSGNVMDELKRYFDVTSRATDG